jgi:hypothetical protein
VIVGEGVLVGVRVGRGVLLGKGVLLGGKVLVGGGGGEAVNVLVGVGVTVKVLTALGTALRIILQPLSNKARTPKSLLTTPVSGPPPPQSLSKSISQRYLIPASKGTVPVQILEEE